MKKYARILLPVEIARLLRKICSICVLVSALLMFIQPAKAQQTKQIKVDVDFKTSL